jgi:urease accessory protein
LRVALCGKGTDFRNGGVMRAEPDVANVLSSQRVRAEARLTVGARGGRTWLERLYQDGAAKVRLPAGSRDPLEAILINTAGGLTGGDRIAWTVEVGAGASLCVTTQACEKLYRAAQGHAEAAVRISVGEGGRLAWLPQETIVYDGSAFARRLEVDLAPGATALIVEAAIFGRRAMGETVARAAFRDRWRVRVDAKLVHADETRLSGDLPALFARRAALGGGTAFASVLLVSPAAGGFAEAARAMVGASGGVSAWQVAGHGKLLARLVGGDSYDLRSRLAPLLSLLNGEAGLPKAWSL